MSTEIEWTDETWNPVTGCTKVSPGCDHCYAERVTERFHGKGSFERVMLHPERLRKPLHWRKPRKVFVNSMSDLFHEQVPDEFIAQVFAVMSIAKEHTFQVLTKRHGRMRSLLTSPEFPRMVTAAKVGPGWKHLNESWWPLPNVWLGVSVEDQKWADIRIPALLETPAAVRFLSCEPLLGPIDLTRIPDGRNAYGGPRSMNALRECCPRCGGWGVDCGIDGVHMVKRPGGIDWVIVGGESGPHFRAMDPVWAAQLRDQCTAAGVPFLFKQWGGRTPKAGGRELDGRIWDEYPQAVR